MIPGEYHWIPIYAAVQSKTSVLVMKLLLEEGGKDR
jgi:hypothetical protein